MKSNAGKVQRTEHSSSQKDKTDDSGIKRWASLSVMTWQLIERKGYLFKDSYYAI